MDENVKIYKVPTEVMNKKLFLFPGILSIFLILIPIETASQNHLEGGNRHHELTERTIGDSAL